MSNPLRLVVFDVDGTLIDSQAHIIAAMEHAFGAVGLPAPTREAILGIVGLSLPQAFARLAPDRPEAVRLDLVQGYKDAFMHLRKTRDASPLYPGARAQVEALLERDDLLVGVATGKSRRGLDAVLEGLGWSGRFVTEQVADHHPSKPHPSMLLTALAETGVAPEHAVMVGDTSFDMDMARAARIPALGVAWGYHTEQALHQCGAALVLQHFDDLPDALDRVWERL